MTRCVLLLTAFTVVVTAAPGAAQTAAPIDRLVENGQKIVVVDDAGEKFTGRVRHASADVLGLLVDSKPIDIPVERVVRIDRPGDGLGNGALIGMTTSASMALLSMTLAHRSCSPSKYGCSSPEPWVYLWAVGASGALGAGIGVAIDALVRGGDREIYRRGVHLEASVAPTLRRGVRGAAMTISW